MSAVVFHGVLEDALTNLISALPLEVDLAYADVEVDLDLATCDPTYGPPLVEIVGALLFQGRDVGRDVLQAWGRGHVQQVKPVHALHRGHRVLAARDGLT